MRERILSLSGRTEVLLVLLVAFGVTVGFVVVVTILANVWPQAVLAASRARLNRGPFDWPSITAVSLVNPVFEEVFVCGCGR